MWYREFAGESRNQCGKLMNGGTVPLEEFAKSDNYRTVTLRNCYLSFLYLRRNSP
jgi:hypothetical protein